MDRRKIQKENAEMVFATISEVLKPLGRSIHSILKKEKVPLQYDQVKPLMQLFALGEMSQQEIADSTGRDKSSVQRTLQNLEKMKLVTIRPDVSDKRRHLVSLTEKGISLAEKIHRSLIEINKKIEMNISKEELGQLRAVLEKMKANASKI